MTTLTAESNIQQLVEQIRDWRPSDVLVDQSQRLIRNIALTGRKSKNGYQYSEQALRQAIPLYENKPVFLDHAANISRPYERSTRDLAGSIVNPRFESGRIRADIQLLDTEAGRTFLALAESKSSTVGMSHVVLAQRSLDNSVVESIHDVVSVDAVVYPATTSTFRESISGRFNGALPGSLEAVLMEIDSTLPDHVHRINDAADTKTQRVGLFPGTLLIEVSRPDGDEPKLFSIDWHLDSGRPVLGEQMMELTSEQIESGRWGSRPWPELSKPSTADADDWANEITDLRSQVQQTSLERDQLRERVERLETERQELDDRLEVEHLLKASALPEFAVTDVFRNQLLSTTDDESRRKLIEERKALLQHRLGNQPMSYERPETSSPQPSDAAIVSVIKRQRSSVLTGIG